VPECGVEGGGAKHALLFRARFFNVWRLRRFCVTPRPAIAGSGVARTIS